MRPVRPVWPVHVHTLAGVAGAAGAWFIRTRTVIGAVSVSQTLQRSAEGTTYIRQCGITFGIGPDSSSTVGGRQ